LSPQDLQVGEDRGEIKPYARFSWTLLERIWDAAPRAVRLSGEFTITLRNQGLIS
jgi:hypothetical protein